MKTFVAPRELLTAIDEALAVKPRLSPRGRASRAAQEHRRGTPLQQAASLLRNGRHCSALTIYLAVGERLLREAHCGPESRCYSMEFGEGIVGKVARTGAEKVVPEVARDPDYKLCFPETRSELAVPIKIAGRVLGVIDAESERPNAFGHEDRVLLKGVAQRLAQFLTGPGKYLILKAREAAMLTGGPRFGRTPAGAKLHAAAGDKTRS